jgi:hypothetical protein
MRLHEITNNKLTEFAPLAALAGLARVAGPAIVRGAAGLGIRGASMIANFLSNNPEIQSNPEVQVAYDNMQKAETEEEQRQWAEEIERQIDQFYGGPEWRDQEITDEGKSPLAAKHANMMEKTPPGREDQVKALKKKWPNNLERVYATAWASYNKRKK